MYVKPLIANFNKSHDLFFYEKKLFIDRIKRVLKIVWAYVNICKMKSDDIQYTAAAYDFTIPKSGTPVTALCQDGTAVVNGKPLHGLRVFLAKQNLTKQEFKHVLKENIDVHSATDKIKLAFAKANLEQDRVLLNYIEVAQAAENQGLGSSMLGLLMDMGRQYGASGMEAAFWDVEKGWNHRVDFYNSNGFGDVPEYISKKNADGMRQTYMPYDYMFANERKLKNINKKSLVPNRRVTEMLLEHGMQ